MKLALEQGSIDMAFQTSRRRVLGDAEGRSRLTVHSGHGVVIRYLVLQRQAAADQQPAVRKAIAYLMPRQDIATRVYHGTVEPLYSMVPQGLPGSDAGVQDDVRLFAERRRRPRRR